MLRGLAHIFQHEARKTGFSFEQMKPASAPGSRSPSEVGEDPLKITADRWNISIYNATDHVFVDMEVSVRKDHSRPDDLAPRDLGVGIPELDGQVRCRFT